MNADTGSFSEYILKLEKVAKTFDGFTALHQTSMIIPGRMVFGLLGPNGAGKTTLLRLITGLISPTAGKLTMFGGMEPGSSEARARIGYMPQSLAIYPNLSVEENMLFFGRMYGMEEGALKTRIDEVLETIELTGRRHDILANLSGGMVRRALLGTTLVHRPKLLLLDEPTAGVDPVLRIKIWETLRKLCDEGTSILITTHHISEADRCDRVVFLRSGSIIGDGTPEELTRKYQADDLEKAFVLATREEAVV
ncbi:MAG: ABC transporter ATP-binding protein [Nitrospinota bacterium]|nr:ABC transporter ATP-binding protein [Nitrospinota bacterium]MDH5678129.1 ABC transporter ATP-binding protein [Nitrospinota bacterium]